MICTSSSFSSSLSSSSLARPPPARVFQPTQEPGFCGKASSSAQRSHWNGLRFCKKRIFFFPFLRFSITFSLNVCGEVPRSDQNCSTIEITENKLMRKNTKQKEFTILFISIFKRKTCRCGTLFLFKVPSTSKAKRDFVKIRSQKRTQCKIKTAY